MNRDDVIRMARESGSFIELAQEKDIRFLQKFAHLIASHVAEECAKACESLQGSEWVDLEAGAECADAIRSLYKPTA